jgi:hypothetical protein
LQNCGERGGINEIPVEILVIMAEIKEVFEKRREDPRP